jgi:hypothetical protein
MSFIFLSKDLFVQTDYDQCGRIEMGGLMVVAAVYHLVRASSVVLVQVQECCRSRDQNLQTHHPYFTTTCRGTYALPLGGGGL